MPGALVAAAADTELLVWPLVIPCTVAVPVIPAGTWKFTCVGLMYHTAAAWLLTFTCTPSRLVGRLLPRPLKSASAQMRVVVLRLVPLTCAQDPGTNPPATYVAPLVRLPVSRVGRGLGAILARI